MRILGLDVGDRRIGVALSDPLGIVAGRLSLIERKEGSGDFKKIAGLVNEHDVKAIVIGLPLTLKGEKGIQAQKVNAFSDTLKNHVSVPIEFIDERLTTVQGERALREMGQSGKKRRKNIDQTAAQLILQDYLDRNRNQ